MTKTEYKVPSMAEIKALPWNGYNVVSTFSGAGGSCLGYRMAGYRVLWASEFIPAAQEVYKLNNPNSILDTRDIREVRPEDVLESTGLGVGEIDILDGSPPCSSFSTAGKREAGWGEIKRYSDTRQRTDDLFFEYARMLKGLQPKVFVAENVSGLVKGTAKGYFKLILQDLKDCGYNVRARVLDAQWLGVPQMRKRLIFVGVRDDLELDPAHPEPLDYSHSIIDALGHRLKVPPIEEHSYFGDYSLGPLWDETEIGGAHKKRFSLVRPNPNRPCNTITQTTGGSIDKISAATVCHPTQRRRFSIAELKRLCAFPDDFMLSGGYAQQWERLGRAVPPVMMSHIAKTVEMEILNKCK